MLGYHFLGFGFVDRFNLRFLVLERDFQNLVCVGEQVWLEGGQYELGASAPLASHWVEVAVRQLLDLLSDALTVLGVKSAVKLVHDVEWGCVNLLDGKDEAGGDHSFLTA